MGIRSIGVMLTLVFLVVGCSSVPKVTRTGTVKDIVIRDQVDPKELQVNAGDEIRYINKRTGDVQVVFLDDLTDRFSCNNGFGGWLGMNKKAASLDPNETASICFKNPGYYRYNIRMESDRTRGDKSVTGAVKVGQLGS